MIPANEKHLTLVCYESGYGGDFFCALLDQALGNSKLKPTDGNNRYWFPNIPFSGCNLYAKNLQTIFSYYNKSRHSIELIDSQVGKIDWIDALKKIYDLCYDEDKGLFADNILHQIKSNLYLHNEFNVGNFHYMGNFPDFDVRKIHGNMHLIVLNTSNKIYHQYFNALAKIKTNFVIHKNVKILSTKDFFDWSSLRADIEIDSGKLFFEDSLDQTISETLSKLINKEIKIDIDALKNYRIENIKILTKYFGEDFMSLDVNSFKEKKFKLFNRIIDREDHQ